MKKTFTLDRSVKTKSKLAYEYSLINLFHEKICQIFAQLELR